MPWQQHDTDIIHSWLHQVVALWETPLKTASQHTHTHTVSISHAAGCKHWQLSMNMNLNMKSTNVKSKTEERKRKLETDATMLFSAGLYSQAVQQQVYDQWETNEQRTRDESSAFHWSVLLSDNGVCLWSHSSLFLRLFLLHYVVNPPRRQRQLYETWSHSSGLHDTSPARLWCYL